jgi:hypothetical protein
MNTLSTRYNLSLILLKPFEKVVLLLPSLFIRCAALLPQIIVQFAFLFFFVFSSNTVVRGFLRRLGRTRGRRRAVCDGIEGLWAISPSV